MLRGHVTYYMLVYKPIITTAQDCKTYSQVRQISMTSSSGTILQAEPAMSPRYIQFTNARVVLGSELVTQDLWVDSGSGKICEGVPKDVLAVDIKPIDLKGKILAPGFIDVQINGAFGFDFSNPDCLTNPEKFRRDLHSLNQRLIQTGTTSYLPTMTSQFTKTYHHVCSPMNKKHLALN